MGVNNVTTLAIAFLVVLIAAPLVFATSGSGGGSATGTFTVSDQPVTIVGNTVTFTATVLVCKGSGCSNKPSGNAVTEGNVIFYITGPINFQSNSIPVGSDGTATYSTVFNTVGTYTVNTIYNDSIDSSYKNSSNTITEVVNNAPLSIPAASNGIEANPSTIDSGQSTTITVSWIGGTPGYTVDLYYGASSCSTTSTSLGSNTVSGSSATFTESPTSNTVYCAEITDSAASPATVDTGQASVTVNAEPTISISPSVQTIDVGQSVTFANNTQYGTPPYVWSYSTNSVNSIQTGNTLSFPDAGTFNVVETVTDNVGISASSLESIITVNPPISVSGANAPSVVDPGQSIPLRATGASGGTGNYITEQWYLSSGTSNSTTGATPIGPGNSLSANDVQASAGTYYYFLVVSDGILTSTTNTFAVIVNPPISVTGNVMPTAIDAGNTVYLSLVSGPTGGMGTYTTQQWYFNTINDNTTAGTSIGSGNTVTDTPSESGYYFFVASDGTLTATTNTFLVTVNQGLTPATVNAPDVSATLLDANQQLTVNAILPNQGIGTAPYTYEFLVNNGMGSVPASTYSSCTGYSGTGGTVGQTVTMHCPGDTFAPNTNYQFQIRVVDNMGSGATSGYSPSVAVSPQLGAPMLNLTGTTYIDSGQSLTFNAMWTGGTSTYTANLLSGASPSCSSDTTLQSVGSATSPQTFSQTSAITSNTFYCASVTDSANTPETTYSSTTNVIVSADALTPTSIYLPSGPVSVDNGITQNIALTAPTTGTAPYTYNWFITSGYNCPGFSSPGSVESFSYTPSGVNTSATGCELSVTVTDNALSPESYTASTPLITLNPPISIVSFSATSPVDVGNPTTLTASGVSGGNGHYTTEQWYVSATDTNSSGTLGTQVSGGSGLISSDTQGTAGTYYYYLVVSDNNSTTEAITPVLTVSVNPDIAVTGSVTPSTVDLGNQVQLSAASGPTGGSGTYTTEQWYFNTANDNSTGTAVGSGLTATNTPAESGYYFLVVSDGTLTSTTGTFPITVNPAISVSSISATSPVDIGNHIILSASGVSGGTGAYTLVQWEVSGTNTNSSDTAVSGGSGVDSYDVENTAGTYYYHLIIYDGNMSTTYISKPLAVTVNPAITIIGANAPSVVDAGQSIQLTATSASGGNGVYTTEQWYLSAGSSNSTTGATSIGPGGSLSATDTEATAGTYHYFLVVSDGNSTTQAITPTFAVAVNPTITITGATAPSSVDVGQPIDLLATGASGGTGNYITEQWYLSSGTSNSTTGATPIGPGNSLSANDVQASAGTYYYFLVVSDGNTTTQATTNTFAVTVNPVISVAGNVAPNTVDLGNSVSLSASAPTGGNGHYTTEQWYFNANNDNTTGTAIANNGLTTTDTPTQSGYYYLVVSDGNSTTQATTNTFAITVNPAISVTGSATPSSITIGSSVSLSATAGPAGGTGNYIHEQWYVSNTPSNSTGTAVSAGPGLSVSDTPASVGTYYYYLTVSDGNATTAATTGTFAVSVANPPPTTTIAPSGPGVLPSGPDHFSTTTIAPVNTTTPTTTVAPTPPPSSTTTIPTATSTVTPTTTVIPAAAAAPFLPANVLELLAAIAAAILLLILFAWYRRRKKKK